MDVWRVVPCDNSEVVYRTKNVDNEEIYYCIQAVGKTCRIMRCGKPFTENGYTFYEPSHEVHIAGGSVIEIEFPHGNSSYEKQVEDFIYMNEQMLGFITRKRR